MSKLSVPKRLLSVDEIYHEGGPVAETPLLRGAALALIETPFARRYEPDIQWFMEDLRPLGLDMAGALAEALGGAAKVEGYGKASLVGTDGELEHGAALLHPKMGAPLRQEVERGAPLVPSLKKRGGPGQDLDVSLGHMDAAYVRSHFDGGEVRLNDAPRRNEILVAIAVADSGRPLPPVGGLTHDAAEGKDGLR